MPIFLTANDIIDLHDCLIKAYGGASGLRDINLLASAIAQPMATYGRILLHKNVAAQAAAYLFHIIKNHPFVDGNKRTSVTTALLFLELNGHTKKLPENHLFELAMATARNEITKEELTLALQKLLTIKT